MYQAGGHCHHIFALLFLVNHWCKLNLSKIPADKTRTSLPQMWDIPHGEKIASEPMLNCTFAQARTDQKGKRKCNPISSKLYDARSKKTKRLGWQTGRVLNNMCSQLSSNPKHPHSLTC